LLSLIIPYTDISVESYPKAAFPASIGCFWISSGGALEVEKLEIPSFDGLKKRLKFFSVLQDFGCKSVNYLTAFDLVKEFWLLFDDIAIDVIGG